ncbi:hypothetical protein ABK040_005937 [Willaertia magna]
MGQEYSSLLCCESISSNNNNQQLLIDNYNSLDIIKRRGSIGYWIKLEKQQLENSNNYGETTYQIVPDYNTSSSTSLSTNSSTTISELNLSLQFSIIKTPHSNITNNTNNTINNKQLQQQIRIYNNNNFAPPNIPVGLHLHKAVYCNSKIYTFGGSTRDELQTNSLYEFDIENEKWRQLSSQLSNSTQSIEPCFYHGFCACPKRNTLYVFGGRTMGMTTINSLYEYNITSGTWTKLIPIRKGGKDLLPRKEGHTCFIRGNCLYIYGGYDFYIERYTKSLIEIDLDTMTWQYLHDVENNESLSNIGYHCSVYCEKTDELIVYAGKMKEGSFAPLSSRLCKYSFKTKQWQIIDSPSLTDDIVPIAYDDNRQFLKSYNKSMALLGDRYLLITNGLLNDKFDRHQHVDELIIVDLFLNRWYKLKDSFMKQLEIPHDSVVINCNSYKKLYFIGGYNTGMVNGYLNTMIRVKYEDNTMSKYIPYFKKLYTDHEEFYDCKVVDINNQTELGAHNIILQRSRFLQNYKIYNENIYAIKFSSLINNFVMNYNNEMNPLIELIHYFYGLDCNLSDENDCIQLINISNQFNLLDLKQWALYRLRYSFFKQHKIIDWLEIGQPDVESLCLNYIRKCYTTLPNELLSRIPRDLLRKATGITLENALENDIYPDVSLQLCFIKYLNELRRQLVMNERKGDLTLILKNSNVIRTCDKSIAIAFSRFFDSLLTSGFEESYKDEIIIECDLIDNEIGMDLLIDLLYLVNPSSNVSLDDLEYMLNIANYFCIDLMEDILNNLIFDYAYKPFTSPA